MDLGAQTAQIDEIYHALSYRVSTAANILAQSEFLHEVRWWERRLRVVSWVEKNHHGTVHGGINFGEKDRCFW